MARILEWVAISSSRGSSQLRGGTSSPSSPAGGFFTAESPGVVTHDPEWLSVIFVAVVQLLSHV